MDADAKQGSTASGKEDLSDGGFVNREITYSYSAELRCGISLVNGAWTSDEETDTE